LAIVLNSCNLANVLFPCYFANKLFSLTCNRYVLYKLPCKYHLCAVTLQIFSSVTRIFLAARSRWITWYKNKLNNMYRKPDAYFNDYVTLLLIRTGSIVSFDHLICCAHP
jgi:hypothetical protein